MRPQAALLRVKNCNELQQNIMQQELGESKRQIDALSDQVQVKTESHARVEGELHKQTKYNEWTRHTMFEELKKRDAEKRSMQQEIQLLQEGQMNTERVASQADKEKDKELEQLKQGVLSLVYHAEGKLNKLTEVNGRLRHQTADDVKKGLLVNFLTH
eukprot:gene30762-35801_t